MLPSGGFTIQVSAVIGLLKPINLVRPIILHPNQMSDTPAWLNCLIPLTYSLPYAILDCFRYIYIYMIAQAHSWHSLFHWIFIIEPNMFDRKSVTQMQSLYARMTCLSFSLCTVCTVFLWRTLTSSMCLFQGEGPGGSGPTWLPGGAGDPVAVDRWRTSTTDHQLGHQLCLWPVSHLLY